MNAGAGAAHRRRTAAFGAIAATAALLTSACAAGRVAQTQNQRPSVSGVGAQVGPIAIRNLTVEAPQGNSYPVGSSLRLIGVFVNNGTTSDQLTDISSAAFTSWGAYPTVAAGDQVAGVGSSAPTSAAGSTAGSPAPTDTALTPFAGSAPAASQSVSIPANGRASYGVPDATGSLVVRSTKSTIYPGGVVSMTLTFTHAGTVTVRVPVNITSSAQESFVPGPSGSASGAGD